MASPESEMLAGLSALYQSGKYSDLTLACGSKRYHVHRALLCSRSHFFDGACGGRFLESKTGQIDLSQEDGEAVEHMVHYFYHLDYSTTEHPRGPAAEPLTERRPHSAILSNLDDPLLATAFAVSSKQNTGSALESNPQQVPPPSTLSTSPPFLRIDRPESPTLKRPSRRDSRLSHSEDRTDFQHLSRRLAMTASKAYDCDSMEVAPSSDLVTHARVYALAEKYGVAGLKALAREKFEVLLAQSSNESDFLDVALEAYTTTIDTDRGLRNVVAQVFRRRPELIYRNDVQEAIHDVPSLALDLNCIMNGIPISG